MIAAILILFAFSPGLHRAMAERAIVLEAESRPWIAEHARTFGRAAAWEDFNVLQKWLGSNHYYSPSFALPKLWRLPSDTRVARLEGELLAATDCPCRAWDRAGHAVHHVQDMASPPHVVPIVHGLGDAFERQDLFGLLAEVTGDGLPAMSPREAHLALAAETEALVRSGVIDCAGREVPWSSYWEIRLGRFGRLGASRFGKIEACKAAEQAFVRDRLDRALAHSRAVVRYVAEAIEATCPTRDLR